MKYPVEKILAVALAMILIVLSGPLNAQDHTEIENAPPTGIEGPPDLPPLADIIPLAADLTVRLSALENKMTDGLDATTVAARYGEIQDDIKGLTEQFHQIRDSGDYKQNILMNLGDALKRERKSFEETSKLIKQAIILLGNSRAEWLAEKEKWQDWRDVLIHEKGLEQLKTTFEKANVTIDRALNLVLPQLDEMFRIQEKGGTIDANLKILSNEMDELTSEERRGALAKKVPPLLSSQFFSQFTSSGFWNEVIDSLSETSWPDSRFFAQQGWIFFLQGLISLFVIITIYKNRALLKESSRWQFLAERTFSAGIFLGYASTVMIYENQGTPAIIKQVLSIVGVVSFARLIVCLLEATWKKQQVYGLMVVLIITTLMGMFSLPLPLFRLFTVATAVAALLLCLRWAKESVDRKEPNTTLLGLRLAAVFFAVIIIAELLGKTPLPFYLLTSLVRTMAAVLFFMLIMHMIRGGLEWLFRTSPMKRTSSVYSDTDALVRRISLFINIAIWVFVLIPACFVLWGAYDTLGGAAKNLLGLGFNLGTQRISLGLVIIAAGFIYGSFLLSWIVQNLFLDKVLLKRKVERGVRVSIKRLVHYILISIGFLLAVSSLGLGLTKLTIVLSALGVGIGFGLQGVVNNLVSGLILLFERPVRVGDYIDLNGVWCEIEKIGLRSTTVQTFDQSSVIIPNADLVTNQVINWTLKNRTIRLIVPVGVAYGSDIPLVIETLKASADSHPMIAKKPAPQVIFLSFGESSLDFELRVRVLDIDKWLTTRSEVHQEIDRRFREAKIEIAFPQRDLRFRDVGESFSLRAQDTKR